jgi:diguanylate cyclase (GGDEF)-like protein
MNRGRMLVDGGRGGQFRKLMEDLAAAIPGRAFLVLSQDHATGSFRALPSVRLTEGFGARYLDRDDPGVASLRSGREWVSREQARGDMDALFPIFVRGEIEHVLLVKGGSPSAVDFRLIAAYCREAGLVLETTEMQETLERKIDRLASLVSLVDDLSVEQNYRNLLRTVLDRSAELLLAEQGSIMLIEKETDLLLLEALKGRLMQDDSRVRVPLGEGIAGRVAAMGEPILVDDIESDPRVARKNEGKYRSPSFVSVPLKIGRRVVGVMNFNDKQTGERFDSMDLRLAQTCASHAAVVLDRREVYERTAELTRQATTDDLTGLMNRACFLGRMKEELARSERYGKMMSLVMLDIDGFKHINDSAGHAGGDSVLRKVAEIMLDAVRSIDLVGRYGGDEFVIALPETDAFFAMHMAERVRADIAKAEIEAGASDGTANRVTVSMGMATYPLHGRSPGVLLEHADEALYRAKAKGRNRIVVY